ncbi:unnamed protein product, partial [Didymodactylos carnosus]
YFQADAAENASQIIQSVGGYGGFSLIKANA